MAKHSQKIGFNPTTCAGMVYMKCDASKCKERSGSYRAETCRECLVKNNLMRFALMQPFEFQLLVPPALLLFLYPSYGMQPINSMEVIALYMAALCYMDALADPDQELNDERWRIAVKSQRVEFHGYWQEEREEFKAQIGQLRVGITTSAVYDALALFRMLEKRICTGLAIMDVVTADAPTRYWKELRDKWMEEQGANTLVEWTFNRSNIDRVSTMLQYIAEFNEQRRMFREKLRLSMIHEELTSKRRRYGEEEELREILNELTLG